MNPNDRPDWLTQARDLLDAEVQAQDYALRAQLTAVRQKVLAQHAGIAGRVRWLLRCTMATAGVCCLALVAHLALNGAAQLPQALPAQLADDRAVQGEDAELLVSSDSLELYENLEFYAWLQSQPVGG